MRRALRLGLLVALACPLLVAPSSRQEKPAAPPEAPAQEIPPEAAQRKNPIAASEESVALGKRLFTSQCVICHGEAGDGKGELAEEMGWKPPDFRDAEKMKERTDGALFHLLSEGHRDMPAQGKRLTEAQRWHLVNFIRSLGKSAPKEKPAPKPAQP